MKRRLGMAAAAALITLSACGAPSSTGPGETPGTEPTPQPSITSSSGAIVGSVGVLKNYFYNNYNDEYCSGWSLTGSTADFVTYGECAGSDTYFWLFSDAEQRDEYMDEIKAKNLPLLVSDEWVIASPVDLTPAQEDIGGAINQP